MGYFYWAGKKAVMVPGGNEAARCRGSTRLPGCRWLLFLTESPAPPVAANADGYFRDLNFGGWRAVITDD